jgi:HSP20 family protein
MLNDLLFLDLLGARPHEWLPESNVTETATQYRLDVDLPGVPRDQVNIANDDGVLSISGERTRPEDKGLRLESRFGKFQRRFRLPDGVVDQEINATHRDGLLTITIPKARSPGSRVIRIQD